MFIGKSKKEKSPTCGTDTTCCPGGGKGIAGSGSLVIIPNGLCDPSGNGQLSPGTEEAGQITIIAGSLTAQSSENTAVTKNSFLVSPELTGLPSQRSTQGSETLSAEASGEQTECREKTRCEAWKTSSMLKAANLFTKDPRTTSTTPKELHPAVEYRQVKDGWVKIKGVMDSGASESVAPPSMCPHYDIKESPGSKIGQNYVSASDDLIPNLGEQVLDVVTHDGRNGQVKYQMADVSRPLNSVSEICDAGGEYGQYVIFGRHGGAIINLETGRQTKFPREDGIYSLEFWVKPKGNGGDASVFPRPGQ